MPQIATLSCPHGHPVAEAQARFCPVCGAALAGPEHPSAARCAFHPERPADHPCQRCGTFACADCLERTPFGEERCRGCAERERAEQLPWDQRGELGVIRAWARTCQALLLRPQRTFSQLRAEGSPWSSLTFAALCQIPALLGTLVLYVGVFGVAFAAFSARGGAHRPGASKLGLGAAAMVGMAALMLVLVVVLGTLSTLAMAGVSHLLLRWTGQTRPFRVTLRGAALCQASKVVGLIPVCGMYAFSIWSIVLEVFAYRTLHRATTGRATLAAVAGPAALTLLGMIAYAVSMIAFASAVAAKMH